jgi:hypothetical protein
MERWGDGSDGGTEVVRSWRQTYNDVPEDLFFRIHLLVVRRLCRCGLAEPAEVEHF